VDDLEAHGCELTLKNKTLKEKVAQLREEIRELKYEVLRHAKCNFWAIDEYLARCAGDLLGMDGSLLDHCRYQNPTMTLPSETSYTDGKESRKMSPESPASQNNPDSTDSLNVFFGDLDEDIDDDA
jgi:hypothetical protein